MSARFGMFITWGPVSLRGKEISWSRNSKQLETLGLVGLEGFGGIAADEYDSLYQGFNPEKYDAKSVAALALEAGMKYVVFVTKHIDGFCMFDTDLTTYTSMHSAARRDFTAETVEAFRDAGLKIGLYISQDDWRHPAFGSLNHQYYVQYLHGLIRHLCTHYGKIDLFWFDPVIGTGKDWDAAGLSALIHDLQPHALINDRIGLPGDFDTPEQMVGKFQTERPWETCMTMGTQWAWKANDDYKTSTQLVRTLISCAGNGGNLLLNISPDSTGAIPREQAQILKDMGRWLNAYGESIYETRGGPFTSWPGGACTYRDNTLYLHILDWKQRPLRLPPINARIKSYYALTGEKVRIDQSDQDLVVSKPQEGENPIDTIIKVDIGLSAESLPIVRSWCSNSLAYRRRATASSHGKGMPAYGPGEKAFRPESAFDDDLGTAWVPEEKRASWLEVDIDEPTTVGRALIADAWNRVREYRLEAKVNEQWVTLARGNEIGGEVSLSFKPVRARRYRLDITKSNENPVITEFQLFPPS